MKKSFIIINKENGLMLSENVINNGLADRKKIEWVSNKDDAITFDYNPRILMSTLGIEKTAFAIAV